jgi:hypothetical protein
VCTLTVAWQLFDEPVVVGANRDEAVDRPAAPPAVRGDGTRFLAPRDERAGGTWIGYNEHGLFVAITNRWTRAGVDSGERSRGLLVRDALERESATAAEAFVRLELGERDYEPFHLLVADAERALLFEHDADLAVSEFAPGLYVVVNAGWAARRRGPADAPRPQETESFFVPGRRPELGEAQRTNATGVRDALEPGSGEDADAWLDRAGEVLGDHDYGVCVHENVPASGASGGSGDADASPGGFGTRSSSLVKVGSERRYDFANGPPCETGFEQVEPL